MTTPHTNLPPRPSFEASSAPTPDYGPDFTQTEGNGTKPPPKSSQKNPPRKSPFDTLGQNKKLRSPIRKLSEQDRPRVQSLYVVVAGVVRIFHPRAALAIDMQADACVTAWFELAENNDKVRRALLAVIEGGDWGKLFMAHLPIIIAVLPESMVERVMTGALSSMFSAAPDVPEGDVPQYPADLQNQPG